ncbi:hypothetical protein AB0H86_26390 [Streptomyces sp. NPDC050997]|uniref:hypothetical protein n=1 Tax=Streptomyces sp. NPDC050997 TaxID=3155519 RepID=UPI003439DA2E
MAAAVGFEALGRSNDRRLSRQTLTSFWRLLLPRICLPGRACELDPAGTAPHRVDGTSRYSISMMAID